MYDNDPQPDSCAWNFHLNSYFLKFDKNKTLYLKEYVHLRSSAMTVLHNWDSFLRKAYAEHTKKT
jgi:hypothetical protein